MKRSMLVLWLATLLTRSAYAVDITTCDEIVPASETGVLLTELAGCNDGVVLAERAALQMNGHSILGANAGVFCLGPRCSIAGPGEISGATFGVFLYSSVKLTIADVNIHDSSEEGIHCSGGQCGVRATGLTLSRNGFGSTFPGGPEYSYNISAHVVRGTNITVTDNAGFGVYADRFNITDLIATGNGNAGLYAGRGRLVDSMVTGNNGFDSGIDIFTARRPRLINSTCGRSASGSPATTVGPPWGICIDD